MDGIARAYSEGSDARLAGSPVADCPYDGSEKELRHAWRRGWVDVSRCWGLDARWPVRVLPAVRHKLRRVGA